MPTGIEHGNSDEQVLAAGTGTPLLRVLATDSEYLIALDIQVTLESRPWIEVQAAVSSEIERLLAPGHEPYDIVIVDSDLIAQEQHIQLNELIDRDRTALIYGTVDDMSSSQHLRVGATGSTYLTKPYTEKNLLAAFVAALNQVHPIKAREVTEAVGPSAP